LNIGIHTYNIIQYIEKTRDREHTYIKQRLSGKILCKTNQKQELPMAAMFINGSG
jgi:hypothetical protein